MKSIISDEELISMTLAEQLFCRGLSVKQNSKESERNQLNKATISSYIRSLLARKECKLLSQNYKAKKISYRSGAMIFCPDSVNFALLEELHTNEKNSCRSVCKFLLLLIFLTEDKGKYN